MPPTIPANPKHIDLHVHSTASDGNHTPAEVVALALGQKLDVIALTDHDCTDGLAEAWTASAGTGLTVLAGVELGVMVDGHEVHLLGYLFDPGYAPLQERLREMQNERLIRAGRMVEKLADLGFAVSLDRVLEVAGEGAVGRPHVAQVLLEEGHAATWDEVFDRLIGDGGPAYVPRGRLTMPEAITLLHEAGGVAVLAHPVYVKGHMKLIPQLVEYGLDGVEVFYPKHDAELIRRLKGLARGHDLVMTGGSDFHRIKEGGVIMGEVDVPPECVRWLGERAAQYQK